MNPIIEEISKIGIVPVIALDDAKDAEPLAKALCNGGIPCAEVTFRTAAAEESIRKIAAAFPEMLVGAGTVLTTEQVDRAERAGAKFIVSPGFNPKVVSHCLEKNLPVLPGVSSPSNVEAALEMGLEVVKFFPAEQAGGLAMLKAMSAPYGQMKFMPTGGINEENMMEYFAFDKVIACGGSWMVNKELIKAGKFDEIEKVTRKAVTKMRNLEPGYVEIREMAAKASDKMELQIKPKSDCKYDAVSLGEVMLRFDPGEGRIRTARNFCVWEGGGEYNVIRGLRKCFQMDTAVITAFADNEVGRLLEDLILQGGVDTSLIKWMDTDGIGRVCRNGLNFTERGFGIRGAVGCSDRANTAISKVTPEELNLEYIFGELGVRWLHTGGIYAALSEQSCETVLAAIRTAKKYGTIVSYDLNYRPSMWSAIGGKEKAREVNREIAKYVDVMIGNEEDFTACLGLEVEGNDENLRELNLEGYRKMIRRAVEQYPNFKAVATTLRQVKTATVNDWSAICWADGRIYKAKDYERLEILDRVGGGDSFASGLIYGLMTTKDAEMAVNYGAAHGALAMTTPGDTTMASKKEVEAVMGGVGARVQR
ncbi:MAG: bifunctional 4-hydroxy-2-oxoglutarate aldolase/2-dehydro-3-deoxy-phosphogluconate aldolase [Lachnospiraceae bacterium]|nr:bifunctional 4-hydroxy-2-oxoglutarate aldolase/2-dehydro-3-deoxy-phosphogluconate aldolase [Lachnospiraceae bacterium]